MKPGGSLEHEQFSLIIPILSLGQSYNDWLSSKTCEIELNARLKYLRKIMVIIIPRR